MTEPTKDAIALADWREKNWHELDASLAVLVSIRDGDSQAKDQLEAIKGIARLLGAMSTRPADAMKPRVDPATVKAKAAMSSEEAAEVKEILSLRRYRAHRPTDKRTLPR
jgi:hypothetical protein